MSGSHTSTGARIIGRSTPLNVSLRQREQELRRMPIAPEPAALSFFHCVILLPLAIVSLWTLLGIFS